MCLLTLFLTGPLISSMRTIYIPFVARSKEKNLSDLRNFKLGIQKEYFHKYFSCGLRQQVLIYKVGWLRYVRYLGIFSNCPWKRDPDLSLGLKPDHLLRIVVTFKIFVPRYLIICKVAATTYLYCCCWWQYRVQGRYIKTFYLALVLP